MRVLCYNVLAESYAMNDRINYCPSWALVWDYRKQRILKVRFVFLFSSFLFR